jgi:hypothetical protein
MLNLPGLIMATITKMYQPQKKEHVHSNLFITGITGDYHMRDALPRDGSTCFVSAGPKF